MWKTTGRQHKKELFEIKFAIVGILEYEQERLPVKRSDREAAPKETNLFWSKIASTRTTQHSFAMTTSFKCGCPGKELTKRCCFFPTFIDDLPMNERTC